MSGLGPNLYLPHGASAAFRFIVTRAEDGAPLDLSGLDTIEFLILRNAHQAAADALLTLTEGVGLTIVDAVAGLVTGEITADECAALPGYGTLFYLVRATMLDGTVHIPDGLRGSFTTNLDSAVEQAWEEEVTRLDSATGTLTPTPLDMSNYTINRHDLTGLTGGTSSDLDGLSTATLDALVDGAIVELFLTGSISARFRLRAKGGDSEDAPWLIVCDNDTTRLWELIGVFKEGVPCAWNDDTSKFHQLLASGTGTAIIPALADEADAFTLPA